MASLKPQKRQRWRRQMGVIEVEWDDGIGPYAPTPLQMAQDEDGDLVVLDAMFERCGAIITDIEPSPTGLFLLTASDTADQADYVYYGPEDLFA